MSIAGRAFALASALLLAACATRQVPPPSAPRPPTAPAHPIVPPPPPPPANAVAAGVKLEAPRALAPDTAARALDAFRTSCPVLMRRTDQSGLTLATDWQSVCTQAASLDPSYASSFFYYGFDWVKVGDGHAFATGYYEPEIEGSRVPLPGYTPIYRLPPDLVRCTKLDGTTGRGRFDETGTCVLYFTRAEIEDGALAGKGLEIAWARDPVDLFFLEIQGSGRIRFPDGTEMRIGYAGQNGREYVGIGRLLRDRGILPPGGANMQSIKAWIRANPEQGRALMRENLSYIFFKELTGPGPLGAMNVPVTPRATVATDPNFVPLGAPVFLQLDRPVADGLWVAQDTGGAIKGPNRFDTFWGAGPQATAIAGGMSASGNALILVPRGVAARAVAQP
ncbi:MAG TPA: MltA domain-containing protein [Sphingomicrobium sp.]|nr:MltA domain-containing protein [Sphingomicrobium sp.]